MPYVDINGHLLYVESAGRGEPIIAVHGGWTNGAVWEPAADALRSSFRVVTYDRLGTSRSERPDIALTRRRHEDDLAALIERLAGSAHLVANSYGAATALSLAARRPDLVRSVFAHEPALADLAPTPAVEAARAAMTAVTARIRGGDPEGGARQFVEEVALGPGGWELLPAAFHAAAVSNAATFANEMLDPSWGAIDTAALARYPGRIVLTEGGRSPAWFHDIAEAVAAAIPHVERATIAVAGHSPHSTHPDEYAALVAGRLGLVARAA
jgi:pimeloyl-ACP methyl ester carboxylesterase